MRTIEFSALNDTDFDIHDIMIMQQVWEDGAHFAMPPGGRPDNGILFLSDCAFSYLNENGAVYDRAEKNDLIFIPKNAVYDCRFDTPPGSRITPTLTDYLINFRIYDETGKELLISTPRTTVTPGHPEYYLSCFSGIHSLSEMGQPPHARIKGLLYALLSDIAGELQKKDIMTKQYAAIYPAIRMLQTTELSKLDTASLAAACHLSPSCFRRLFTAYTGIPPLAYLNKRKTEIARVRLQSGLYTVSEVALSLGFQDISYFSRFYKRMTGHTPHKELHMSV